MNEIVFFIVPFHRIPDNQRIWYSIVTTRPRLAVIDAHILSCPKANIHIFFFSRSSFSVSYPRSLIFISLVSIYYNSLIWQLEIWIIIINNISWDSRKQTNETEWEKKNSSPSIIQLIFFCWIYVTRYLWMVEIEIADADVFCKLVLHERM